LFCLFFFSFFYIHFNQLSEKKRTIAQHKIELAELKEQDFQYRSASLEQIVSLYSKRLACLEQQRRQLEDDLHSIRNDRDRTNQKLQETTNIVTESVNHIESLQAKVHETEASLTKTQQMYTKALEEAKAAKSSVRALRSSLYAAETTRITELEALHNQLNNVINENKQLKASIKSIEASASQHVQELSDKISHLESAANLSTLSNKENYSPLSNRVTSSFKNQQNHHLPRFSHDLQSQSSEEHVIVEFKTCLDVVYSQLTAAETLVTMERQHSEALQESLTSAQHKHSSEVAQLQQELMKSKKEQHCLTESIKVMQSSLLNHSTILCQIMEQAEKDTEEATNRLEQRIESLRCQLTAISVSSDFHKKKDLASLLEKLQGEYASLESDKKSIDKNLQICRKALSEKEDYISLLKSELSSYQNDEGIPISSVNQSDEHVPNMLLHTNMMNHPLQSKHIGTRINDAPDMSFAEEQERKILMLEKSNNVLKQELTNRDDVISKLISTRDGLERDLTSVKSVLDVAQNEIFLFCEMLLKSQKYCTSPVESLEY
jgi:hypothetical protein